MQKQDAIRTTFDQNVQIWTLLAALLLASTQRISGQISNFKIFKRRKEFLG